MTKPHTTLSEAVRAMNRAKLLPVWDDINHKLHVELDIIFKALDAADLVEKAEEEKPIDRAIRTGEPELFSFAPDQSSVRVVWPNGEVSLYVAESAEGQEPVGEVWEDINGTKRAWIEDQSLAKGANLYAQPTLAATQADEGREAQVLRRLLAYNVAGAKLYTDDGELKDSSTRPHIDFRRDSVDTIEDKLGKRMLAAFVKMAPEHIIAAMSPTTDKKG